jgi:thiamine-phosphate pyrophosphorylase
MREPAALPARGLYALTPDGIDDTDALCALVEAALAGGTALVQYRDKVRGRRTRHTRALRVRALCRAAGVPFVVNDDIALAAAVAADGAHVGRDDPPLAAARAALGPRAIIGVSCYDSLARAREAAAAGADYVAFGSFYPSSSKPQATPCPLTLLDDARRELALPIVAIGGITPDNAPDLVRHGADFLAVISAVFASADVRVAARRFADLFTERPPGDTPPHA